MHVEIECKGEILSLWLVVLGEASWRRQCWSPVLEPGQSPGK